MKAQILSINGEKLKEIELPKIFSSKIRGDITQKAYEAEKEFQPYAPAFNAGRQQSASGRIRHIRHKWRSAYGRGISRIPRKTMWRRGTQFYWIGAEISSTRGGRRAHPPRISQFSGGKKLNKKEGILAFNSAIASTANEKMIFSRYKVLENKFHHIPLILESKIITLKSKELLNLLKKLVGKPLEQVNNKEKTVRSGKGKLRGRKYKRSQGMIMVIGNEEKLKSNLFDIKKVNELKIKDLYPLGRLTIYTENAIKALGESPKEIKEK